MGLVEGAQVKGVGPLVGAKVGEGDGAAPLQIPDMHTSLTVKGSLSSHLVRESSQDLVGNSLH